MKPLPIEEQVRLWNLWWACLNKPEWVEELYRREYSIDNER